MRLLAMDVGGTEIKYSVMDEDLSMRDQGAVSTPMDTMEHFLDVIESIYTPHRDEVEGIAMSIPGFVDVENGVIMGGGALIYNRGQHVAQKISERCGCPVRLANDAKAAAKAELERGALKGCSNALAYIIGTGIGGAVIVNGEVINGVHATAGELSFLITEGSKWENFDGLGISICSTGGMCSTYKQRAGMDPDAVFTGRMLFERYHAGEELAHQVLEDACRVIAVELFNLSVTLDLERIAIGGGISRQPVLIETIDRCLHDVYLKGAASNFGGLSIPEIVPCRFHNEANQIGAYCAYVEWARSRS